MASFLLSLAISIFWVDWVLGQQSPNILLILTDDQDVELHGMYPMYETSKLLGQAGAQFHNAFTPTPICCPARASLLTGQYAHNHRTFNNSVSGGCNGPEWLHRSEPRALPVILQNHGYRTFFAGKYLNQFRGAKVPRGWNEFYGLHGNSRYYNYTLRENSQNVSYTSTYLTDLLRDRAVHFLRSATQGDVHRPFFAMVAPPAPHAPYTPAPRHRGVFSNTKALRTPSFNNPTEDKHWLVGSSAHLSNETIATIDRYFQGRWESLLAVDELVAALVAVLNETKSLENTYIIYTSDNGYHMGQFAQPFDKRQPYETDIHVPLLIRGPGIAAESHLHVAVSLIDLAPTVLDWAGITVPHYMDGRSIYGDLLQAGRTDGDISLHPPYRHSLLIEYWGEGNDDTYNPSCPWRRSDRLAECTPEAACHCQDSWNNTFACLRDFKYNDDRIYCQFSDNENFSEAYDLRQDPYQMVNIVYDLLPIVRALYRLRLQNLTKCSGQSCIV
ncbi:GL10403 [Drosophila persimilis]|uniref:GL10403 n=1 Tax=Drosophila persimilis TaxID=7234 RepID=B4GCV2_DROPE|nr:N-acetylglucosamine-6-sulfatase [Drosophila persimilis]EDW32515.1 GL10403 [Drosophila persimilis]